MNISNIKRDAFMLKGLLAWRGYDLWRHSFFAQNTKTGESRPFFIEFFACNPALGEDTPTLGQLSEKKLSGKQPSYLMVKVGWWGKDSGQIQRFFPWKEVKFDYKAPLNIVAEDCICSETELKGSITLSPEMAEDNPEYNCEAGSCSWDLVINKKVAFNMGYSAGKLFRLLNASDMYWHIEGLKTAFKGRLTVNGTEYTVRPEYCLGYADKLWGSEFPSPWLWITSHNLTSRVTNEKLPNSVFGIVGRRPNLFALILNRRLISTFWYEGKNYEFNFHKFQSRCRTTFSTEENSNEVVWTIRQETTRAIMESKIRCPKNDMLLTYYESPDGKSVHKCLSNNRNGTGLIKLFVKKKGHIELIDEIVAANVGCEYGEYDKN